MLKTSKLKEISVMMQNHCSIRPTYLALLLVCCIALVSPEVRSQEQALVTNLEDVDWGPPGGGNGAPVGVQTAQQGIDPNTKGVTYFAKFPAESHFDLHWHTHNEFVAVMSGKVTLVLGDQTHSLETGSYIVIPGKMNHSWDVPAGADVVILVRRAGSADFHFVE
jgi:quercetin dioxygenase-like cupin family protein